MLSNFAYTVLDRLSGPLLGSQRRCHADALSPALGTCDYFGWGLFAKHISLWGQTGVGWMTLKYEFFHPLLSCEVQQANLPSLLSVEGSTLTE